MGWILATSGALLLGVVTNLLYDLLKKGRIDLPARLDRRALPAAARHHDVANDGLTPLVTWSGERQLSPQTLATSFAGRLDRPHLLQGAEWSRAVQEFTAAGKAGSTAYISSVEVDTREHARARKFRVTIAQSAYVECLAAVRVAARDGAGEEVIRELERGLYRFVEVAPPTMVSACVSVVSREGRVLALRRSLSVETFPGQWTIGVNESMKYRDEPGDCEDFFALVRRALDEELGLRAADYGTVHITWLGWSRPAMCWVLVAVVRSSLRCAEIDERRSRCHSVYEHDLTSWLPLNRRALAGVIAGGSAGPDGTHPWSYLAPTVALETWRFRGQL